MNVYLDTSALIKLIVAEEGSDVADDVWEGADALTISRLGYPEARAALAAARRSRRLSPPSLQRAKRLLERRWRELSVLELDPALARAAGELSDELGLRAADAVHLASALLVGADVLATWDERLARGGVRAGLAIVPSP